MDREWSEMGEVLGCVMDWMMNKTCGWENGENMDSFCERKRKWNAMQWRGRIRVNDGQKMQPNRVCVIPQQSDWIQELFNSDGRA